MVALAQQPPLMTVQIFHAPMEKKDRATLFCHQKIMLRQVVLLAFKRVPAVNGPNASMKINTRGQILLFSKF
jgi:hypothetical protein